MNESVLRFLVDPETQQPLRAEVSTRLDRRIVEGRLLAAPSRCFPIRAGIPSFVGPELEADQTVLSFAQKWAKHRYYREHTRRFYTQWYLDRYGFFEPAALQDFLVDKAFILDAGTGSGRDAVNFAEFSEGEVFAVDTAWEALEIARKQVVEPRITFVHADLHRLPFRDEFFDFINCDQVIHHTPDPRAAFEILRRKLKPGGQICCYVYRRKSPIREFTDDYVRERISGLPAEQAMAVCEGITKLGHTLANLRVTVHFEEDLPILGIKKGPIDLQRLFHWHVLKCFWNEEFDFFTNNIVNFDWYHPRHCFRFEPAEFRAWFAEGWDILAWDVREAGMSCRARKV